MANSPQIHCELWTWRDGKHRRCTNIATVVSHPAGFPRVVLNTCAKCDEHRKKEGLI